MARAKASDWGGRRPKRGGKLANPNQISRTQAERTRGKNCAHKVCGDRGCWLCVKCQPHDHGKGADNLNGIWGSCSRHPAAQFRGSECPICKSGG